MANQENSDIILFYCGFFKNSSFTGDNNVKTSENFKTFFEEYNSIETSFNDADYSVCIDSLISKSILILMTLMN